MNSGYVRLWAVGALNIFLFLCAGCAKTEIQAEEVPIFTKDAPNYETAYREYRGTQVQGQ